MADRKRGGQQPKGPRIHLVLQGSPSPGTQDPRKEFDLTVTYQISGFGQTADLPLFLGVEGHEFKRTFRDHSGNPIVIKVKNGVGRLDKQDFSNHPHFSKLGVMAEKARDVIDLPDVLQELPPGAEPSIKQGKPKLFVFPEEIITTSYNNKYRFDLFNPEKTTATVYFRTTVSVNIKNDQNGNWIAQNKTAGTFDIPAETTLPITVSIVSMDLEGDIIFFHKDTPQSRITRHMQGE